MIDPAGLAAELLVAARTATPVEFISARHRDLDWSTARAIARATDEMRRAEGEQQVGYKLGWTSQAMREALGVDRPNWGTLWQHQVLDSGSSIDMGRLIHPKVEPELVWRVGADLSGPGTTAADVSAAGGEWALGLEVVDPRFPTYGFDALDNTADNSSSALVVVGEFVTITDRAALDAIEVTFTDGTEVRTGPATQAMDSPAGAVAWLVRSLAAEDSGLTAGQIVFTGGLTAPFDLALTSTYRLSGEPLSPATLSTA